MAIQTQPAGNAAATGDSNQAGGTELPPEFDVDYYRRSHADLAGFSDEQAQAHYRAHGRAKGRAASPAAARPGFLELLAAPASLLEIGPLANPLVRGPQVRYFDVLASAELKSKAIRQGLDPQACPDIDYVSADGDLAVVPDRFDAVASSHSLEHQPDLIAHLRGVARLLPPGGHYFLAVPDKRYCFDHFLAESSLADVLDAHERAARTHTTANIIRQIALTTHNDPARHWAGDHGRPHWQTDLARVGLALAVARAGRGRYVDCHAWQFTPDSFRSLLTALFELGLMPFRPQRVYDTVHGSNEFYAVLEHAPVARSSPVPAPEDFDAAAYLTATGDVARPAVDPSGYRR